MERRAGAQTDDAVREFTYRFRVLVGALGDGRGWFAVLAHRDPGGVRAYLDGTDLPPWDVVLAVLQDLAAQRGTAVDAGAAAHAERLHRAAVAEVDAAPEAGAVLRARLDAMQRQRHYAVVREREAAQAVRTGAADPAVSDRLVNDLAWARDDRERATARCLQLQARLDAVESRRAAAVARHEWFRQSATGRVPAPRTGGRSEPPASPEPTPATWQDAFAEAPRTAPFGPGAWSDSDSRSGPGAWSESDTRSGPGAWSAPGPGPNAWAEATAAAPEAGGPGSDAPSGEVSGPQAWAEATSPFRRMPHPDDAWAEAPVPDVDTASSTSPSRRAAPGPPAPDTPAPDPASPGSWSSRTAGGRAAGSRAEGAGGAKKRGGARYGGARFAGAPAAPVEPAEPLPGPAFTTAPTPAPATAVAGEAAAAGPRGARFAGAGETHPARGRKAAVDRAAAEQQARLARLAEEARGLVARLGELRRTGDTGAAYVLMSDIASGPADRVPAVAEELDRAGRHADVATLLWEIAAQPPESLVAAAVALVRSGRADDCRTLLHQAAARPAAEIALTAGALCDADARPQAVTLLAALARTRTPEDAAGIVYERHDLVGPLLDAASQTSMSRRRDVAAALRRAGLPHAAE